VRFLLDENVTVRLVDALANLGIDAISANRDYKGFDDATLLLTAAELKRVLVTYNIIDFLLLHRAWLAWSSAWVLNAIPQHAGILLVHSAPGYDYARIAGEIKTFVDDEEHGVEIPNRVFAWNSSKGWNEL